MDGLPLKSAGEAGQGHWFVTTHWSVVLAAGQSDPAESQRALETLCRSYWPPLYAYLRRAGHSTLEAEELTQEFFGHLLEKNAVGKVDPERGRFRTFLLCSLKHFLINEWVKAGRQKRGGRQAVVSLDAELGEAGCGLEVADELSPDKLYERKWATTLLERVLRMLGEEYAANHERSLFERLKDYVWGERGGTPYAQAAEELQLTEGAVKVRVHRLRKRLGELLRMEIAQTVPRPEDVDEELRYLMTVVSD